MVSNEALAKIMQENQNSVPQVQTNCSSLSRLIYVLEKDTKNLLQYDRQTNRVVRARLNYRVNGLDIALPHNY